MRRKKLSMALIAVLVKSINIDSKRIESKIKLTEKYERNFFITTELMMCSKPDIDVPMCRECMRCKPSKDNEYEAFNLKKDVMQKWVCDGFLSKRDAEDSLG